MHDSKEGLLPMLHSMFLSKGQSFTTSDERERMSKISYTLTIGSIMCGMICIQSNYLRRTKDSFLVYGGKEELIIWGYTNANFQINHDDS
ncbi:hypothetical protein CR513_59154, partial [Mucuna pruriens]